MENVVPVWQKQNLTIQEATYYSNIGTTKLRQLIRDPMCPFVLKVGNKYLIKRKQFDEFIARQIEI
jgi:excisionase family DNA binding protein